jgi:N-formylglutamate amidohydrolase
VVDDRYTIRPNRRGVHPLGSDEFHTPLSVRDAILTAAEEGGYSVAVDAPFAGALVPLSSYQTDRRILSVMIEVNRRLYVDEHSGVKNPAVESASDLAGSSCRLLRLLAWSTETLFHDESGFTDQSMDHR